MPSLFQRIFSPAAPSERGLWPMDFANIGGLRYPLGLQQTLVGNREEISRDFAGMVYGAYQANGIVYASMLARASLFSEARFVYRQLRGGRPGDMFSKPALEVLRHPWPGGTTGDLLVEAITDLDLAGNAFILRRGNRLIRLRPDWTAIIHGSKDANGSMWNIDAELLGYSYQEGGPALGAEPKLFDATEVAHFRGVTKDPLAPQRGMSWLTPIIREIEADSAATSQKLAYFVNGATANLVVSGISATSKQAFDDWVAAFEGKHKGVANAYKTLYLTSGADAKVVGSNMREMDFKAVQAGGETRIAAAAGVPPIVAGLSEGLQGSSLNAGNFEAALRRFADITIRPLWRNMAGSLAVIVPVPDDAELWYDDRDIPALANDVGKAAEVRARDAQAINSLITAGFEPDSIVSAITADDLTRLKHTGLYSVQLQPPQPEGPPEPPSVATIVPPAQIPAKVEEKPSRSELLEYLLAAAARSADEDDHYYGAWSGGKKSEGGAPASQVAAGEAWLKNAKFWTNASREEIAAKINEAMADPDEPGLPSVDQYLVTHGTTHAMRAWGEQAVALGTQFPEVRPFITVASEADWNAAHMANRAAQYARDASGASAGAIQLDSHYFVSLAGDVSDVGPAMSPWWGDNGFHPVGTGTPAGIITHEWGHAVQDYLQFGAPPATRVAFVDWVHSYFDGAKAVSGYGATGADENFAEAFAAAFTLGAKGGPLSARLRAFLLDNGVYKP
jgi:phage portal protein BeeE